MTFAEMEARTSIASMVVANPSAVPLYHGSPIAGIRRLASSSEQKRYGAGVYLSTDISVAGTRAITTADSEPRIYECQVAGNILDMDRARSRYLRSDDLNTAFRLALTSVGRDPATSPEVTKDVREARDRVLHECRGGGDIFEYQGLGARVLSLLGFDGMKAGQIWIVFNPEKVRILAEKGLERVLGELSRK